MLRSDLSGYYDAPGGDCAAGSTTVVGLDIVQTIEFETPETARPVCVSIDELIAKREVEPGGVEALQEARKRLSKVLPSDSSRPLQGLRLQAGLSQAEVAKRIGTSQPHYARIESGATNVQLVTAIKLALVLGVDANAIARVLAPEFNLR